MIASFKDVVATVLTAASVLVAWAAVAEWGWPLTGSVRGAAVVAVVLGLAACTAGSRDAWVENRRAWYIGLSTVLGVAALVGFLMAVIAGSEAGLVLFAAATAALWLASTVRHLVMHAPQPAVA